jgi:hypothetical protein
MINTESKGSQKFKKIMKISILVIIAIAAVLNIILCFCSILFKHINIDFLK